MQTNNTNRIFTAMIIDSKYVSEHYLSDEIYIPASPNIRNKNFIDNWMDKNYQRLYNKFNRNDDKITKKGYTKTDIMHESIIRIYINRKLFKTQEDCDNFLNNFFHIKIK